SEQQEGKRDHPGQPWAACPEAHEAGCQRDRWKQPSLPFGQGRSTPHGSVLAIGEERFREHDPSGGEQISQWLVGGEHPKRFPCPPSRNHLVGEKGSAANR